MAVMEAPDRISRSVLERGLDANTAFEIVSIDIADIDVGENIGGTIADRCRSRGTRGMAMAFRGPTPCKTPTDQWGRPG